MARLKLFPLHQDAILLGLTGRIRDGAIETQIAKFSRNLATSG